jgi:hypothetical protein
LLAFCGMNIRLAPADMRGWFLLPALSADIVGKGP